MAQVYKKYMSALCNHFQPLLYFFAKVRCCLRLNIRLLSVQLLLISLSSNSQLLQAEPGTLLEFNTTSTKPNYTVSEAGKFNRKKQVALIKRFQCFSELELSSTYFISLCADIPDNKDPDKILFEGEPGHVFIILTKINGNGDTASTVFGFYPRRVVFCFLCHYVKSKIDDNSDREYDVHITKELTAVEFAGILERAVTMATKKYHLKKYNCYDFAIELFNTVSEKKVPVRHVKLPVLLGKCGSPSVLYKDLKNELEKRELNGIAFGSFRSPKSCVAQKSKASISSP